MFFLSKVNRTLCKQSGKATWLHLWLCLILVLFVSLFSCRNVPVNKTTQHQLQSSDTLKIRAESIFRIYVSKMPRVNGDDSLLLLLDRTASLLYKVDTSNVILDVDTLPNAVTDGLTAFAFYKGKYYMLYENLLKIFSDSNFVAGPKLYSFDTSNGNAYHPVTSQFEIDSNGSFLIYRIPKLNISEVVGRNRYFSSDIVYKGIIEEGKSLIKTEPQTGITFPERYKKFYYNDRYPLFCSFRDTIAYVVNYADSLAIMNNGKKEYFSIPKQFSVVTVPAPEISVESKTESSRYFATHSANGKLLRYKRKILLFQIIGAEKDYDEQSGMLNDLLSLKKRVVIFDVNKRQFEQTAYMLPANCNPVKSVVFNGKLYLLSTDDARKEVFVISVNL